MPENQQTTPAAAPVEKPRRSSLTEVGALFASAEEALAGAGDAVVMVAVGGRVLTARVIDLARHMAALDARLSTLEAAAAPAAPAAPEAPAEPPPVTVTVGHVTPPAEVAPVAPAAPAAPPARARKGAA